jgi:hypothetical protein
VSSPDAYVLGGIERVSAWSSAVQTRGQIECKCLVSADAIRWSGKMQFPISDAYRIIGLGAEANIRLNTQLISATTSRILSTRAREAGD